MKNVDTYIACTGFQENTEILLRVSSFLLLFIMSNYNVKYCKKLFLNFWQTFSFQLVMWYRGLSYWLFWIKLLKKWSPALWPSSLSPWKQDINLSCERCIPYSRQKDPFITEIGNLGQEAYINKPCYFFKLLPQDQTV